LNFSRIFNTHYYRLISTVTGGFDTLLTDLYPPLKQRHVWLSSIIITGRKFPPVYYGRFVIVITDGFIPSVT